MSEYVFKDQERIVVGWAEGLMETEQVDESGRPVQRPYFHLFTLIPVSSFKSNSYQAVGLKAEKLRCVSSAVWKDLAPMEVCKLYFDDRGRVSLAVSTGELVMLESGF